jgi:hypothetical protein
MSILNEKIFKWNLKGFKWIFESFLKICENSFDLFFLNKILIFLENFFLKNQYQKIFGKKNLNSNIK